MGDWLGSARPHRRSGLSNIPENARVEARLFFTLIGSSAWQIAEALTQKSAELYPGLEPEQKRFSLFGKSGNRLSLPRSGKPGRPAPSFLRSGNDAPFVCKVLLDEQEPTPVVHKSEAASSNSDHLGVGTATTAYHRSETNSTAYHRSETNQSSGFAPSIAARPQQSSDALSIAPSTRPRRSLASRRASRASRTSRVSAFSRSGTNVSYVSSSIMSSYSSYTTGSTGSKRRMAAISYYPVEKFVDEVPITNSTERWRYSCLLFLLDPRQEAMGQDTLGELQRRQQEIKMQLRISSKAATGVVPGSPNNAGIPPVHACVIFHRPPSAWMARGGSVETVSLEAVDESTERFIRSDEKYQRFLDSVRELVAVPTGVTLWHYCNFDDTEEVLKCHIKIAQSLVDPPKYEIGAMLAAGYGAMAHEISSDSEERQRNRRCVVM